MLKKKQALISLGTGICLGLIVWFGVVTRTSDAAQEVPKKPVLTKLPQIKSCLQHVKLIKAELKTYDGIQFAELELENQAYIGVIAISVETWFDKNKHEVVKSAFTPDKEPAIIIAPRERKTITIGNVSEHAPIRIAGAMFVDGTEEGCESSLKTVREIKAHNTKPRRQDK